MTVLRVCEKCGGGLVVVNPRRVEVHEDLAVFAFKSDSQGDVQVLNKFAPPIVPAGYKPDIWWENGEVFVGYRRVKDDAKGMEAPPVDAGGKPLARLSKEELQEKAAMEGITYGEDWTRTQLIEAIKAKPGNELASRKSE